MDDPPSPRRRGGEADEAIPQLHPEVDVVTAASDSTTCVHTITPMAHATMATLFRIGCPFSRPIRQPAPPRCPIDPR